MIVQIVRFTSELDDAEVLRRYETRVDRYRSVPGLVQKYYLRYPDGDHGAVYVWQNQEALNRFRDSMLARTIADTYRVQRSADTITAGVVLTLHPARVANETATRLPEDR